MVTGRVTRVVLAVVAAAALQPVPPGTSLVIEVRPTIMAGERGGESGDSPARRVDVNVPTSPFAGVGSLVLVFPEGIGWCSGTLITPRHALTAAHCVVDGTTVLSPDAVSFVLNADGDRSSQIAAAAIDILPGYLPNLSFRFDMAVVTLAEDAPASVPVYDILRQPLPLRTTLTMVGYGLSGDGHTGIDYLFPITLFSTKRSGRNVVDFIGRAGQLNENVFFYDFDPPNAAGLNVLGGLSLGNEIETSTAFGDSGGPSFVEDTSGQLIIAGINNFGIMFRSASGASPRNPRISTFGEGGGGLTVPPFAAWIDSVTGAAPLASTPNLQLDDSDVSTALIGVLQEADYAVVLFAPREASGEPGPVGSILRSPGGPGVRGR